MRNPQRNSERFKTNWLFHRDALIRLKLPSSLIHLFVVGCVRRRAFLTLAAVASRLQLPKIVGIVSSSRAFRGTFRPHPPLAYCMWKILRPVSVSATLKRYN